jgi:N6-adenosine-specific RNA methylase IME4
MPQVFEDIIVDAEFASLSPPLSAEERQQLEENIVEHGGARDPLVVWVHDTWTPQGCTEPLNYDDGVTEPLGDGSGGSYTFWDGDDGDTYFKEDWPCTLLDGHNRYEICRRLGLPFDVHELRFKSRDEAEDWIDRNQLGRRNLTADSFNYLLGRRVKRAMCGSGSRTDLSQNDKGAAVADVAKDHGVSTPTAYRAAKFYEEVERTPALKQAVDEGRPVLQVKRELKEQAREARREENRKKIAAVPEPEKAAAVAQAKYATIVIDPPWDWGDEGDQDQLGRARPDYSTMSIEQLERLDVGGLADDDCHIYLWITNRSLPKGFRLLEAWGFRYITAITWVKPHFGMGNYFRGQTEHVLFGVKGSQPLKRKDVGTVFEADRGPAGHSSKPPAFLELVESCSPGPFLEMFSRSSRDGWVAWGENTNATK